jgi:hypothetical protein
MCHVYELAHVELTGDCHALGRSRSVLADDDLGFAGLWVIAFERVRAVQQRDDRLAEEVSSGSIESLKKWACTPSLS